MSRPILALALAMTVAGTAPFAHAQTGPRPVPADRIDVQTMENRLRALNFHDQQQRYREQDRRDASSPLPRAEVPVMRPRCAPSTAGSRFSGC